MITPRFSPDNPVSCAQGRHGEIIIVQGNGIRPARSNRGEPAVDAGMDPPVSKPEVTVNTPARHYIARVDVYKPGLCYYAPPPVTFTSEKGVQAGGRAAKASSFLAQSVVSEIRVDDGGKYYIDQPSVELGDTYGKGAVLEAVLSGTPSGGGGGDPYTGITEWKIVQAPPYLDGAGQDDGLTWYYAGGDTTVMATSGTANFAYLFSVTNNGKWDGITRCPDPSPRKGFNYTVTGATGSGATVKLTFGPPTFNCSSTVQEPGGVRTVNYHRGARQIVSATAVNWGRNYSQTEPVVLRIPSASGNPDRDIILHGLTSGNPENTAAETFGVKEVTIKDGGKGFLVAPQIKFISNSGFGAFATCKVKDGKIVSVTLESGGNGYKTPPTIEVVSGGAEAFAVARPHLRGKYQCYYRYIDDTPEDRGGPIPSNLSPVLEVDAGEGAQSLWWVVPPPKGRATKLELWRTTSNQATTLYRVATLAVTGGPGTPPPDVPGNPVTPPGGPTPPPPGPPPSTEVSISIQPRFLLFGDQRSGYYERATLYVNNPQNRPITVRWYGRKLPGNTDPNNFNRWVCSLPETWTLIDTPVFPSGLTTPLYTKTGGVEQASLFLFYLRSGTKRDDPYMWNAYQEYRAEIEFAPTGGGPAATVTSDVFESVGMAYYEERNCGEGWLV